MKAFPSLWNGVRSLIRWFEKDDEPCIAIAVEPALTLQRQPSIRNWSAYSVDPAHAFELGSEAARLFANAPVPWDAKPINESTTRLLLIDPMLKKLGWFPLLGEIPLKEGGRPDYLKPDQMPMVAQGGIAIEAKSADPLHDDISKLSGRAAYANHAEQLVSYLDSDGIRAAIFTNARVWWRVERDAVTNALYALRFNLHDAQNLLRNRGRYEPLGYFASLFHAGAFRIGSNYSLAIHPGRSIDYGAVGRIRVKDLNKGLIKSSLDD